ncbi:MAG: MFS transporter [Spirochaetia bacterium]|nr:MFS transporter [Spirochaetia bacterium]
MQLLALFKPAAHKSLLPEAEQNSKFPALRWQILEATFLGYTFYYFTRNNFQIISKEAGLELGYDKGDIGLILMATSLAYAVGKFVLGALSDKSNPRMFMPAGLLLSAACNFAFGASSNFWVHVVLWTLNGFVQGAGWPPCGRSLGHWYSKEERGTVFGFWNIAHNMGGALIGVIAAASAAHWGWRSAFYVPGVIAVISAAYLMYRLRDTPQSVGIRSIEEFPILSNQKYLVLLIASILAINGIAIPLCIALLPPNDLPGAISILNLFLVPTAFWIIGRLRGNRAYAPVQERVKIVNTNQTESHSDREQELSFKKLLIDHVLTNRIIWTFALANFFVYIVRYSLVDWGPTYLKEAKQASIQSGGISTFVFEGAAIASTLLIGWISDKAEGRRGMVSLLCMIPILAAMGGMILMPPGYLWAHITLFGVVGFFVYPPVMLLGVAGLDFTSKKAVGAAAGFIGFWGYLGKAFQSAILGRLAESNGWTAVLIFIAIAVVLSIATLALTWKLKPAE